MIFRFIIFAILFYLVFKTIKNLLNSFSAPSEKINNDPQPSKKHYDLNEIEDIDYEEVERK